jgi:hypothetical protein
MDVVSIQVRPNLNITNRLKFKCGRMTTHTRIDSTRKGRGVEGFFYFPYN